MCVAVVLGLGAIGFTIHSKLPERAKAAYTIHDQSTKIKTLGDSISHFIRNEAELTGRMVDLNNTITVNEGRIKTLLDDKANLVDINTKLVQDNSVVKTESAKYSGFVVSKDAEIVKLKKELASKPKERIVYKDKEVIKWKEKIVYKDKPVEQLAKGQVRLYDGFDSIVASPVDGRQVLVNGVLYARTDGYFYGLSAFVSKTGYKIGTNLYKHPNGSLRLSEVNIVKRKYKKA